jgi:hypothetical protein
MLKVNGQLRPQAEHSSEVLSSPSSKTVNIIAPQRATPHSGHARAELPPPSSRSNRRFMFTTAPRTSITPSLSSDGAGAKLP